MKKSKAKNTPVEIIGTKSETDRPPDFSMEPPAVAFGDHTVWIGGQALKRLVEQTNEQYPDDDASEDADEHPGSGLRQVEAILYQFQDVMGVPLRLIFGPPENPLHELVLSEAPATQGELDNDMIQQWVHAGASLIGDVRKLP